MSQADRAVIWCQGAAAGTAHPHPTAHRGTALARLLFGHPVSRPGGGQVCAVLAQQGRLCEAEEGVKGRAGWGWA